MADPKYLYTARMSKPHPSYEEYNFVFRADSLELAKDHMRHVVFADERYKNHKIIRVERF